MRAARRLLLLVSLFALTAVVVACSGTTRTQVGAPSRTTAVSSEAKKSAPATTTSTTEPRRARTGSGKPVTIAFAGDSSFEGLAGAVQSNPNGLLSGIAPLLSAVAPGSLLSPVVVLDGARYAANLLGLSAVPLSVLGEILGSALDQADPITDGLDAIFRGHPVGLPLL